MKYDPEPGSERPSLLARAPGLRDSVMMIRETLMPPERKSRRKRMGLTAGALMGLMVGVYVITQSLMWVFMVTVVCVPIVVLPSVLLVGMVLNVIEERRQHRRS